MITIYTNPNKTQFFYCNSNEASILTIELKPNGTSMSTINGSFAAKMINDLKYDLKYNFDGKAMQICPTHEFAEAFLQAQRNLTNAMNPINQNLYQSA